ncbi:hypothetical protein KIW84_043638 [Lathyrus oleraceus]|uniref:Uncharacterized protein n=1 Tax=Pisum sativum TaxID=3888 RepID=A0A9D4XEH2_PEA|nr:hypothetical protein KIW84_043638 [Pisum sativum]
MLKKHKLTYLNTLIHPVAKNLVLEFYTNAYKPPSEDTTAEPELRTSARSGWSYRVMLELLALPVGEHRRIISADMDYMAQSTTKNSLGHASRKKVTYAHVERDAEERPIDFVGPSVPPTHDMPQGMPIVDEDSLAYKHQMSMAKTVVAVRALPFLGAFSPYYIVHNEGVSLIMKILVSLLSPTTFALGPIKFADYERTRVELHWSNIWWQSSDVEFPYVF